MNKNDLKEFIDKYYLGGTIFDSANSYFAVPIEVTDDRLKTTIRSSDKSVLASVDYNLKFMDGAGEIVIGDTKEFLSFLSAFSDDIDIKPKKVGQDYFNQLEISDDLISAKFALADPIQIETRHSLKYAPETDITVPIKKDWVDRFVKAKKAISTTNVFTIIPGLDNKSVDLVVNYSATRNVNSITVKCEANPFEKNIEPLTFNATHIATILQVNSGFRSGLMKLSGEGLMIIEFTHEDCDVTYYVKPLIYEGN